MDRIVNALNSARSPFHWMTFGGFLTIAVIVRLAAFQGYSDSDPRAYAKLADDLAHGTLCIADYHHAPNFPLRCGVYAPVALLIKAFGLSEWTLVAYPMVVSVLGCLLAYAMTRGLGTPLAGLIAMGGVAVIPMDVSLASRLYPDAIGAFWGNLGIALVVVALSRLKSWQSVTLGVLSGTIFGVSWLCKESIVYQVPFVAILVLAIARHFPWRSRLACLVAIGAGALAVLFAETAFYGRLTGDPLFRFHETERGYVQCAVWCFDESSPTVGWKSGGYVKALIKRLFIQGPKDLVFNSSMGFASALAILGMVWTLLVPGQPRRVPCGLDVHSGGDRDETRLSTVSESMVFRNRSFVMAGVWLISLLLMYNFMTTSFRSYRPLRFDDRYLYPILMPSLILMGLFLSKLLVGECSPRAGRERRFWAVTLVWAFAA